MERFFVYGKGKATAGEPGFGAGMDAESMINEGKEEIVGITEPLVKSMVDDFHNSVQEQMDNLPKLSLGSLDIDSSQWNMLMEQYQPFLQMLEQKFGYEEEKGNIVYKLSDDQFAHFTGDNTVMQLLMQELIDVNQKQLDGIYNLPQDSSFYVPLQARELEPEQSGMALSNDVVNANTEAEEQNTQALAQVTDAMLALAMDTYAPVMPEATKRVGNEFEGKVWEDQVIGGGLISSMFDKSMQPNAQTFSPYGPHLSELIPDMSNTPIETKLTLEQTINTSVMIDKQVLGNTISTMSYEELVRMQGTSGAAVNMSYVGGN
jgi:hypothetical protein